MVEKKKRDTDPPFLEGGLVVSAVSEYFKAKKMAKEKAFGIVKFL
jgi:hypothetical protein